MSPSSHRWHEPGAARQRERALRRAEYRCERCGRFAHRLEVHHLVPASEGGTNNLDNLLVVDPECHRELEKEKHDQANDA